jgi:hypothetical protein
VLLFADGRKLLKWKFSKQTTFFFLVTNFHLQFGHYSVISRTFPGVVKVPRNLIFLSAATFSSPGENVQNGNYDFGIQTSLGTRAANIHIYFFIKLFSCRQTGNNIEIAAMMMMTTK